jgi:serine/threonine protein kinase
VSIFTVLSRGEHPFPLFQAEGIDEALKEYAEMMVLESIANQEVQYPSEFSEDAVDLLKGMLKKDPKKRPSIKKVLKHPFFTKMAEVKKNLKSQKLDRFETFEKPRDGEEKGEKRIFGVFSQKGRKPTKERSLSPWRTTRTPIRNTTRERSKSF